MTERPDKARSFLACLGAALWASALTALLEIGFALCVENGLIAALPAVERLRYLGLVLCTSAVVAVPAALVGFGLSRWRHRLGVAVAFAAPPLLLATECFRSAGAPANPAFLQLGGAAAVLGLALAVFATVRRPLPGAGVAFACLAAALVGNLALPRLPEAGGPAPELEGLAQRPHAGEATPRARNVLFLLVDTLRADHLGCYGYERDTSPRIDALAFEGVLFEHAATPKPKTSPAVASLFTGTGPQTHRVHAARTELLPENVTLAEILRAAGFRTFGVSANANINKTLGFGQGFDEFRLVTRVELADGKVVDNHADQLTGQAVRWLEEQGDEPFFAYVHLIDPHSPYRPPAPYDELFRGDELYGRLGVLEEGATGESYFDAIHRTVYLPEAGFELDEYVSRYDGEIRFTDDAIGKVLDALERTGLDETTLVVFLSDHGESTVEHNAYFNHGLFPYEEQIHVPLILRGPGVASGVRRLEQVALPDLMPTVLEILGVPIPQSVEAISFASLLGEDVPQGPGLPSLISARERAPSMTWCLRTNRWKYLFNPGKHSLARALALENLLAPAQRLASTIGPIRNYQLEEELYDLQADPGEAHNLAYREARVRDAMGARMEELRRASQPIAGQPRSFSSTQFSDEVLKDLIRLGYMGE